MLNLKNILLSLLVLSIYHSEIFAQDKLKKSLFIIVDGIPPDVIERVNTPALDEIASVGGYTRAYTGGEKGGYSETPTISAVGYNSLLTGTWANKHNVWGNSIKNPNYRYWSIFRFLEAQYPEKRTAIFSTWLDNRTKLIGEGLPQNDYFLLDYHFDGFENDTVNFPHAPDRKFIYRIDEHVADEAARYVRNYAPDLSWVYLEFTDDMGHKFGDSPEMDEAVRIADKQVGRIWAAIKHREANFNEDWLIVITTDHGRDAETGKHHGGQSERERAIWITANAKNLNEYFREEEPGIVSIFPTLARHHNLDIPQSQVFELDGVPLTGEVSIAQLEADATEDKISLHWQVIKEEGKARIWLSCTNGFAEGTEDEYELLGEVAVSQGSFSYDAKDKSSDLYKIVVEAPHNTLNHWIRSVHKP